jgi:SAM-dependent methyltransferase
VYQPETSPAAQEPISHTQPVSPSSGVDAPSSGVDAQRAPEDPGTVEHWVSAQLHRDALERFVPRGSRVLELSTGAAQVTEVLHRLGCKVSVLASSAAELEAARARARERGFESSVELWAEGSIVNLSVFADTSFDAIVAYGGPLGHALERRDRALTECIRVLAPRGLLIVGVYSLWGSMHRHLPLILGRDLVDNRAVIRSGNVAWNVGGNLLPPGADGVHEPASSVFGGGRPCHLFRAAELEAFLRRGGLELLALSSSSALSTGLDRPIGGDPSAWSALLEYERAACVERGYLDSGTQLIAVARR